MRRTLPFLLPAAGLAAVVLLLSPGRGAAEPVRRASLIDEPTRTAIDRGLRYLVRTQNHGPNNDGSWTSDAGNKVNDEYSVSEKGQNVAHVGVTALGVLAFLAAGHLPGRGPYGAVVDRAVAFILSRVQPSGFIAADQTRMYSHAFATLALAEVYGMSRAPELREKLQAAVEFTVKCQNETGGWRYVPFTVDSDMSVTVCQVVALRAARNVGIRVPQSTIDRALHYVIESAITDDSIGGPEEIGAFQYQPKNTRFNRSSFALTAAGLTTLFQAGLYDNESVAAYVRRRGISKTPVPRIDDTVAYMRSRYRGIRDFQHGKHYYYYYGNYYAAQAMYNVGGQDTEVWEHWYDMVRKDLLDFQQTTNGPDGAGPPESYWESNVGRTTNAFATAVAILILSMPFDYLPIHQR